MLNRADPVVLVSVRMGKACRSAARNFASSSGEYVDVETSFNLGFGLFKSVVEIVFGVDAAMILSASDVLEATWMSEISTLLDVVGDLIADIM